MADGSNTVAILGAGAMGAGIAQVAAQHGWSVLLKDVDADVAQRAIDEINSRLGRLVEKGRMTSDDRHAAASRLRVARANDDLRDAQLLIEAIVEDLDLKSKALRELIPHLRDDAIIASNTSSLSITALGHAVNQPQRTVGMHFFNPAPLMQLVEVIAGRHTTAGIVERAAQIATSWGKKVARAADVPGFIVNHVARPYYLEAFRILEDRFAQPAQIDDAMKRSAGFRMGPLELTDLIGQDINTATTRSVWEQLDQPPLLAPSTLQESLVARGELGRKTKRGVYDYAGHEPQPALTIDIKPLDLSHIQQQAVHGFASAAFPNEGDALANYIAARILAAIILQAHHAEARGVATRSDVDIAMQYGVNYPKGPFAWAEQIGDRILDALFDALNEHTNSVRFTLPHARAHR